MDDADDFGFLFLVFIITLVLAILEDLDIIC